MAIEFKTKLPKPVIEKHNGYIIRKLGRIILAIPEEALCFYHGMTPGESTKRAIDTMKTIIDEGK